MWTSYIQHVGAISCIFIFTVYTLFSGESIWSHSLGPVAQALQTDLPEPEMVTHLYTSCIPCALVNVRI